MNPSLQIGGLNRDPVANFNARGKDLKDDERVRGADQLLPTPPSWRRRLVG